MIGKEEFWDDVKNELSKTMQTISYEIWIEKLEPVCFVDSTFVLAANTAMAKKTIDRSYLDQIREVVNSLDSFVTDVEIIVKDQEGEYLEKQSVSLPDKGLIVDEKYSHKNKGEKASPFLEKYTFETFVQGKSNEYALAAAKTVAENPGGKYNPLFIYSGVGLGKTHLLHAIGNYLRKKSPKTKVVYANCETMINELISVIRGGNNEDSNRFREKYRACDVLMIDDIQFLSGKEATQEAFFHIFNDLYQSNKQIIITSDRAPKDLPTLEDRLRTRFSWGLSVDIQPPNMETRVAILKMKAAHENFKLSDEVAEFIAENATTNIREMEGLLNKIIFFSSLANRVIDTKELAYDALQDFIDEKKETLDAEDIVSTVCRYFNITTADIFSKKKTKNIVEPRMIAIYLITDLLSMPLISIGQLFGGRDHTTVIHARDKISEEIKTNPRIKIIVADLKNMLLNR
ncbi:MAG TPA: chromosomal replication initiator protein DnaA [Candidatus Limadaptatus stercorigallinarum]|uniref:Chromosomal replication initiator protein DnaA n=1 Tax=Candidatus Limadaptatus stercorigallinarum TaxID=2840845 RepID=A0A9D1HQS6_9FIRM|nr:chromosomal replication initiator protein DnaA [Christensenellales bacterium]HIU20809.1 chromosomal replication initiator protein DnaA [Candidatus Limadaptatus stercorigallinarum]